MEVQYSAEAIFTKELYRKLGKCHKYMITKEIYHKTIGGRERMTKHLSVKYANVAREAGELFKSYCVVCQEERKRPVTKGIVMKPILSNVFGTRSQLHLVESGRYTVITWDKLQTDYGLPVSPNEVFHHATSYLKESSRSSISVTRHFSPIWCSSNFTG